MPWKLRLGAPFGVLVLSLLAPLGFQSVAALLTDSAVSAASSLATDTLDPATNLAGNDIGAGVIVTLTWTATPDTYATGYRVFKSINEAAFTELAQVTPRTTTTYQDNSGLSLLNQYRYYVVTYHGNWLSVQSNTVTCTAVVVVLVCS